jgi:predicted HicB family RNase H-like nuclease
MSLDEPQRLEKKVMRGNFTLRLKLSLFDEARQAAEVEGVSLNRLVNVAVGEKLSVLRTELFC